MGKGGCASLEESKQDGPTMSFVEEHEMKDVVRCFCIICCSSVVSIHVNCINDSYFSASIATMNSQDSLCQVDG